MLAHGVNVVGMFFIADAIERRTGTRNIADLGGLTRKAPVLTVCFLVLLLGTVALPLTNGFVGEFLLLAGVYQFNAWMGAVAGITIILGAVYLLRMFQRVMLGPDSSLHSKPSPTSPAPSWPCWCRSSCWCSGLACSPTSSCTCRKAAYWGFWAR